MDASEDGLAEQAGLYDPDEPDAAERLALLEYLTERGATIEQMVEAHRIGDAARRGRRPGDPGQDARW